MGRQGGSNYIGSSSHITIAIEWPTVYKC